MRKFNIKVNGKAYEVEVEELGVVGTSAPVVQAPVAPVVQAAPQVAAPQAAPVPQMAPQKAGSVTVSAPMPGTINAVKVKAGDSVTKGQVLVILEAMKMENEIMAEADGVVASVAVNQGQSVNTGDVLVTLN